MFLYFRDFVINKIERFLDVFVTKVSVFMHRHNIQVPVQYTLQYNAVSVFF